MKQLIAILMTFILALPALAADEPTASARDLARRILGEREADFIFKLNDRKVKADVFSISTEDGKTVIEGNNVNSLCTGLNYYLRNYAGTSVSWYLHEPVYIPEVFPAVPEKVTVTARVPERFFLNYCTFGYTIPYWNWAQWERLIDWMALNGVNMPLAITGQEAVWHTVWSKLGMTDEEIRSYFTGPAHLPWQRMCNIDRWQGPLPTEWLDNQKDLQKLIVDRERELGMRPVLQGFGGHVPARLKELYPDANTSSAGKWGGYDDEYLCTFLYPSDPLFKTIQKEYLAEQTRLYGTDHIYGVDCFNEVDPPSFAPDTLRTMGRLVYESLAEADPDAVWVQMGWLFYYNAKNWTKPCIKAYVADIPKGRLQFLDYYCDFKEIWHETDSFFGHDFIWCYLGNFGGNSCMVGDHAKVKENFTNTLAKAGKNVRGIGSTLEGMDVNPYIYEMVLDQAWKSPLTESDRIASIARRRTGDSPAALQAWTILADSIYAHSVNGNRGSLNCSRPTLKKWANWKVTPTYGYSNKTLAEAWRLLIEADGGDRDTYQYDLVNVGRQALGNHFTDVRDSFTEAYEAGDVEAMRSRGAELKELIDDISILLACHPSFSLKPWIDDARNNISDDPALQDYFEENARTIITTWGTENLTDYANRALAELNDQYYGERWRRFIDAVTASAVNGTEWDQKAFDNSLREFERSWSNPHARRINYLPQGDARATSQRLYKKWLAE